MPSYGLERGKEGDTEGSPISLMLLSQQLLREEGLNWSQGSRERRDKASCAPWPGCHVHRTSQPRHICGIIVY